MWFWIVCVVVAFSVGWIGGAMHARLCALESIRVWCDEAAEESLACDFNEAAEAFDEVSRECGRRLGR